MKRSRLMALGLVAVLAPVSSFAAGGWSQLKAGMTRSETVAVLGTELAASRGRGFEIAIYDAKGEVVFVNGLVVAWTSPTNAETARPPESAFQFSQVSRLRAAGQPARAAASPNAATSRPAPTLPSYRL